MTRKLANNNEKAPLTGLQEYVTVTVNGQWLGVPISQVHDVFVVSEMTAIPLCPPEIVGLLNLRGRVVTAVSLRRRLRMPDLTESGRRMAIGLEQGGEAYGLLVDDVGEVLRLNMETLQPNPVHLDPRWTSLSLGVAQLSGKLLIILDVEKALLFEAEAQAA